MKKILLTLALSSFTVAALRADILFNETFNYADGPILTNAPGVWFRHSGTANPSDAIVKNKRMEVSATGGTLSRQDDTHRNFTTFTNTQTILYSSFIVNCTNFPNAAGSTFAHFYVSSTIFHGRVAAVTGVLSNTWRLGISGASSAVNKVFPFDLATNTDYQVVVCWDPVTSFSAALWVNPLSSGDPNVVSSDAVAAPAASVAYAFRQPSTFGNFFATASNLVVATAFDEAATNTLSTNAVAPVVLRSPTSGTNFVGDVVTLTSLAAGQGLASMTYQWQKDGGNIANPYGNSNVFAIASAVIGDSGDYRVIATTPFGLSATSAVASLWVTNAPIPPTITPTNNSTVPVFNHQSTTLTVSASGPPTITYQWYYTNAPVTGANVSDPTQPSITISDVFSTNDTTGAYYCVASNPYGSKTSGVFTVTAVAPPAVSIAYLRRLVDTVNYNATNTSNLYQVTGTVTTFTNITTANTSSYFLQDGTAGINIFATFGSTFRPAQGDVITWVGFLSSFNSTLELGADTVNNPATSYTVLSNNIAGLPAPKVIPFNITNDLANMEYNIEGSTVMLTNVYFGTNAGNLIATNANTVVTVTNAAGETFTVFFSSQDLDTANNTLPAFAWSVVGVLNQNLGNAVSPRNQGYQLVVTRFSDIVTDAPPAVTASVVNSGSKTVSWTAGPYTNSYSVLAPRPSYDAAMSGAQEVPPNGSTATGTGRVVVSADGSSITVNMSFAGLTGGAATAAHIHGPTGPGTNAGVLFAFSGVPNATSGSIPEQSFALTPTQAGYLHNGLLYMNVHNSTFPGGEIRGQLYFTPPQVNGTYLVQTNFQAAMLGVNEVPANVSTATGSGVVVLSPDQTTITVSMSFAGLTTPATAGHIHGPAGAGTNASVIFPFSGVPGATSGAIPTQSFAITPAQVGYLQGGLLYMNVHNSTYPGGEIRAQIVPASSSGLTFRTTNGSYVDKNDGSSQKFYLIKSP